MSTFIQKLGIQRRGLLLGSAAALGAGAALSITKFRPAEAAVETKIVHKADIKASEALRKAILESPRRSEADKKRDEGRKPAETMAFFGIKPGMKVA